MDTYKKHVKAVRLRLRASISLSKRIQTRRPVVRFTRYEPSPLPPLALRPRLRHRNESLVVTKTLYYI